MKTSSEAFEKEVDQQAEYFNNFSRVYLRNEHRRSSSHLFNHRVVSIHLLRFDLIRSQRKTRLQTKKECRIDVYEKHSNLNDVDHRKRLQNHCRRDVEHRALFVLNTSIIKHNFIRRVITSNH